jgi:hypothetical protein
MRERISVGIAVVYTIIAIMLGALRLAGHKDEVFQAIAHIYTGAFIGASIMGGHHKVGGWKYYLGLAIALSVLELFAFITGIGRA